MRFFGSSDFMSVVSSVSSHLGGVGVSLAFRMGSNEAELVSYELCLQSYSVLFLAMHLASLEDLKNTTLFVYGVGGMGAGLLKILRRWDLEPLYFVDSAAETWGKKFEGVKIVSPEESALVCQREKTLIIVASSFVAEISETLSGLGLKEGVDFVDAVRFAVKEDYETLDTRFSGYRDLHAGMRAFLVGNGPSLRMEDLDRLQGEVCFAANKIFLAYESTRWRPSYYCVCDPQVSILNQERIREVDTPKFLANSSCFYGEQFENGFVLPYFFRNRTIAGKEPRFSENPMEGIFDGGSVIYMMMQLAYFMGIRELYLIGLDHSFDIPKTAKGALLPGGGTNHFHPDYRPKGELWSRPDFDYMERAYAHAKAFFENKGGAIYNASRKSALTVYPRVDFDLGI